MIIRDALETDAQQIAAVHAANWRFFYRGALRDEFLDGDIVSERSAFWAKSSIHHGRTSMSSLLKRRTKSLGLLVLTQILMSSGGVYSTACMSHSSCSDKA
jgi:hypothetical protein